MAKMKRKKPKEFFSPSLKVNNYSLVRSKIAAHEINKDLGAELGKYVNKVLEKKLDQFGNGENSSHQGRGSPRKLLYQHLRKRLF